MKKNKMGLVTLVESPGLSSDLVDYVNDTIPGGGKSVPEFKGPLHDELSPRCWHYWAAKFRTRAMSKVLCCRCKYRAYEAVSMSGCLYVDFYPLGGASGEKTKNT